MLLRQCTDACSEATDYTVFLEMTNAGEPWRQPA